MTPQREAELLSHVAAIPTLEEVRCFREVLRDQLREANDHLTPDLLRALVKRTDELAKQERARW